VLEPRRKFAIAVGAGLAAGTLVLFWSLYCALRHVQAFA
jgi:hypothetical protein